MSSNKAPINIIENLQNETTSNFSKKQETSNTSQMNNSSFNEITSYYQSPLLQTLATVHQRTKSNMLSSRYNNANNWQESNLTNKYHSNQQQQYQCSQKQQQIPQQSEFNIQTFQNKENIQTPIQKHITSDQVALHSFGNMQTSSQKSQAQLSQSKQGATPKADFHNQNPQLLHQSNSIIPDFNSQNHNRSKSMYNDQYNLLTSNTQSNTPMISIQAYSSNNQKNFYPQHQEFLSNQISINTNNQLKENNNSTGFKTSNLQSDRMNEYIQKLNYVSNQNMAKISNMKMFAHQNGENMSSNFPSQRSQSQYQSQQNQSQLQIQSQSQSQNQQQLANSQSQAILFQPINHMGSIQFQQNNILKKDQPLQEKILNIDLSNLHQNSNLNILNNHNNQNNKVTKQINSKSQVNLANYFSQNQNSEHQQNYNNYSSVNSNSNQNAHSSYNNNINLQKSASQNIIVQQGSQTNQSNNQNILNKQTSTKNLKSPTKHILHKIFNQSGRFFEDLKSESSSQYNLKQNCEKKIIIQQQKQPDVQGKQGDLFLQQLQKNQNIIKIKEIDNGQSVLAMNGSAENNENEDGDSTHYKYSTRDSTNMNNKQSSEQQRLFKKKFNELKKDEVSKIVFESIESLHKPIDFNNKEQILEIQRNIQNSQLNQQKFQINQQQGSSVLLDDNTAVNHKHYKKQLLENIVKELEKDQSFENICKKNYQSIRSNEKRTMSRDNSKTPQLSPKQIQNLNQDQIKQTSVFKQDTEVNRILEFESNSIQNQEINNLKKIIQDLKKQNATLQQNSQVQNYIRLQSQMMKQEGQIKLLQKELKIQKELNQDLEDKLEQYLTYTNFNSVRNY